VPALRKKEVEAARRDGRDAVIAHRGLKSSICPSPSGSVDRLCQGEDVRSCA
jgi:hypothetical protein